MVKSFIFVKQSDAVVMSTIKKSPSFFIQSKFLPGAVNKAWNYKLNGGELN